MSALNTWKYWGVAPNFQLKETRGTKLRHVFQHIKTYFSILAAYLPVEQT